MEPVLFDFGRLPPEELEAGHAIWRNLMELQHAAENFRLAVDLFMLVRELRPLPSADDMPDWSDEGQLRRRQQNSWMRIAGRSGAIDANGCRALMTAIKKAKAPTVWASAAMAEREAGWALFAAEFPNILGIRNAAAHPGELSKDAKEMREHMKEGPFVIGAMTAEENSSVFISGSMQIIPGGMVYRSTFKGEIVEYELSYRKANVLDQVTRHYIETFRPFLLRG